MNDLKSTIESVFRRESGRIIAGLIRVSGSFDLAEEAMQDAFAVAVARWPAHCLPGNPAAWITAVAHRKLIDYARRAQTRRDKEGELLPSGEPVQEPDDPGLEAAEMNIPDDRLRLIFTCCHPALSADAQVALTLRTLGGLSRQRSPAPSWCRNQLWRSDWCGPSARSTTPAFRMRFLLRTGWRNAWLPCRRSFT